MSNENFIYRYNQLPVANQGDWAEGYAARFYDGTPDTEYRLEDDVIERIDRHAFDDVIASGRDVIASYNHDFKTIFARRKSGRLQLSIDDKGLKYRFQWNLNDPEAVSAKAKVDVGDLYGSSIAMPKEGHQVRWGKEGKNYIRNVTKTDVVELGPVVTPAYEATSIRSQTKEDLRKELALVKAAELIEQAEKLK